MVSLSAMFRPAVFFSWMPIRQARVLWAEEPDGDGLPCNVLFVSGSRGEGNPGPGVFRLDLTTGAGGVQNMEEWSFTTGMAMDAYGTGLLIIESFLGRVLHVPMRADGTLCILCHEPERIYRRIPDRRVDSLIEDNQAVLLAHPTNVALKGNKLYTANLGRWHIIEIDLSALPA
jgi:hypothetical protein